MTAPWHVVGGVGGGVNSAVGVGHAGVADGLGVIGDTEAVWGASSIPAAQPVALFAGLAQEFSWADYRISISVGFL